MYRGDIGNNDADQVAAENTPQQSDSNDDLATAENTPQETDSNDDLATAQNTPQQTVPSKTSYVNWGLCVRLWTSTKSCLSRKFERQSVDTTSEDSETSSEIDAF